MILFLFVNVHAQTQKHYKEQEKMHVIRKWELEMCCCFFNCLLFLSQETTEHNPGIYVLKISKQWAIIWIWHFHSLISTSSSSILIALSTWMAMSNQYIERSMELACKKKPRITFRGSYSPGGFCIHSTTWSCD